MGYRVSGILKLPNGTPANNAEIEFISRKNFSPLVRELKSNVKCSATGAYDVTLEYGEYAVIVYPGGTYPAALGTIILVADTVAGQDLPTLLQQAGWQPATQEYIQQISAWLVEANASASAAKVSEVNAKASETATQGAVNQHAAMDGAHGMAGVSGLLLALSGKQPKSNILSSISDSSFGAFGSRNLIVNGSMRIWQRGTSVSGLSPSSAAFCADRWRVSGVNSATRADGNGDPVPYSHLNISRQSGGLIILSQGIDADNCANIGGKLTLTAWSTSVPTAVVYAGGSYGANPDVLVASGRMSTIQNVGGWGRWSFTFDSNIKMRNGCLVELQFNDSDVSVTGVQLERGAVATELENQQTSTELAACKRYFQVMSVFAKTDVADASFFMFPVQMARQPSVFVAGGHGAAFNCSSEGLYQSSANQSRALVTISLDAER